MSEKETPGPSRASGLGRGMATLMLDNFLRSKYKFHRWEMEKDVMSAVV